MKTNDGAFIKIGGYITKIEVYVYDDGRIAEAIYIVICRLYVVII